ncbi:MAG: endolytic transglycosylase MltG [Candidatus Nucleicultricaceae bacterium]
MGYFCLQRNFSTPTNHSESILVRIPKGTGLFGIARILKEHQVVPHTWSFITNVILRFDAKNLKAGEYEIKPHATPKDVYGLMRSGHTYKRRVTIIEGLKTEEVLSIINSLDGLRGEITRVSTEGQLLPETYFFEYEDERNALVERMQQSMKAIVQGLWNKRSLDLPIKSARDAVILASIIEKETALSEERPRVAAVFLNRLRIGMPLQADPTVVYGLELEKGGTLDRELNQRDLTTVTSYNTYIMPGLPPTPICNPSKASLEAVLNPAQSSDLYFVADGTGRHIFSKTYAEHAIHHQALRKLRAKQAESAENNPLKAIKKNSTPN